MILNEYEGTEKLITHQKKKVICKYVCVELPAIFFKFSFLVEDQLCTNCKLEIAAGTV